MQFDDIIGQEKVKERLINSVKEGRISHAQLFASEPGCGGLPLAVAYAQYINCQNRSDNDSCGQCASCIKFNKLIHPDLHLVYPLALSADVKKSDDKAKEWRTAFLENPYLTLNSWFELLDAENKQAMIGVNESDDILRKLNLTTYEAEYKIMIIWRAEKMNAAAANKLLKILEEPPQKTLFLLVCENEEQLLPTITSRTQLIGIPKIADKDLIAALMQRYELNEDDALNIANLANGNYAEAELLINEDNSAKQHLSNFQHLMRASIKFNPTEIIAWIDDIAKAGRERQKSFLIYALHVMRESLILNNSAIELSKLNEQEIDFVQKFSPFIHSNNAQRFVEELNKAHFHMERNGNPKIIYMDLAFKFNELLNLAKPN